MSFAHQQLRSFVDRVCNLNDDIKALNKDKSSVYQEAKANGFDTKVLKAAVKRFTQLQDDHLAVEEFDAILDLYMQALLGASDGQGGAKSPPAASAGPANGIVESSTRAHARASLPPHDEDGVIIEPEIAPALGAKGLSLNGDAARASGRSGGDASPINSNTPGQSGTAREAPSQSRDTVRCPSREEGEGASALSPINSDASFLEKWERVIKGVTASPEECGTRIQQAGSADGGDHDPRRLNPPTAGETAANSDCGRVAGTAAQSNAEITGQRTPDLVTGVTAGRDRQPISPAPVPPKTSAEAPGTTLALPSSEPGAQFPCEANGWAGLEPPPMFDRLKGREAA